MLETANNNLALKKSYEIAYALWRISANIEEKSLAGKLTSKGIELLGFAVDGNYEKIVREVVGLEYLVRFGVDANALGMANGDILIKEIGKLKMIVAGLSSLHSNSNREQPKKEEIDISDIFSDFPAKVSKEDSGNFKGEDVGNPAKIEIGNEQNIPSETGKIKSEIRQSAILERIRQIGNCRLNDIQVILPDCSERTIRYDLEFLVGQNLVEKVGTGGRSVYYRISGGDLERTLQEESNDNGGNFYPPATL